MKPNINQAKSFLAAAMQYHAAMGWAIQSKLSIAAQGQIRPIIEAYCRMLWCLDHSDKPQPKTLGELLKKLKLPLPSDDQKCLLAMANGTAHVLEDWTDRTKDMYHRYAKLILTTKDRLEKEYGVTF